MKYIVEENKSLLSFVFRVKVNLVLGKDGLWQSFTLSTDFLDYFLGTSCIVETGLSEATWRPIDHKSGPKKSVFGIWGSSLAYCKYIVHKDASQLSLHILDWPSSWSQSRTSHSPGLIEHLIDVTVFFAMGQRIQWGQLGPKCRWYGRTIWWSRSERNLVTGCPDDFSVSKVRNGRLGKHTLILSLGKGDFKRPKKSQCFC